MHCGSNIQGILLPDRKNCRRCWKHREDLKSNSNAGSKKAVALSYNAKNQIKETETAKHAG